MKPKSQPGTTLIVALCLLLATIALPDNIVQGQAPGVRTLSGTFSISYASYNELPLVVGLIDASPYWSDTPVALPTPEEQIIGTTQGRATSGSYTISVPEEPPAFTAFDITTGEPVPGDEGVMIFDVRLLSDVTSRGYMVPNEDNIASSVGIDLQFMPMNGRLVVYATGANGAFPIGRGADQLLFTADDPRGPINAGWTVVDMADEPYVFSQAETATLTLISSEWGSVVDYTNLSCAELIPTFFERVELTYPFTELHNIDWQTLRERLVPLSQTTQSWIDCERIIREFGNAIPDGHVGWDLPLLRADFQHSVGLSMAPLTDGRIVVENLGMGGAAQRAGIEIGAIILEWDAKPIEQAAINVLLQPQNASTPHALLRQQLINLNQGPSGSSATVTYLNPGDTTPTTVTLDRGVPMNVVRSPFVAPDLQNNVLPSGFGYIRIDDFNGYGQYLRFERVLSDLIAQDVPGIIIDVRFNPGGWSQVSDAMASRFFDEPFVLGRMFVDDRQVFQQQIEPRLPLYTGEVAVLVNYRTSSAGDLFAYTFKSTGRGQIVGVTPSGGLAGTVSGGQYYLPNGGFIQVPTGELLDDNNMSIVEGVGVVPDVLVPYTQDDVIRGEDIELMAAEAALAARVPAQ